MKAKNAIVIDKKGYKMEFVLVEFFEEDGKIKEEPIYYKLNAGESLIYDDVPTALSMIAAKWDGEKWVETGKLEITPEMMEQMQISKLQEINSACQSTIYAGVEVETSEGMKHFSLTEHDQTELLGLMAQVKDGALPAVPYHADGELCKLWSIEDFTKIAETSQAFIFYNRAYCNHLRIYIRRIEDYAVLSAMKYGVELPADLQASMAVLLGGDANA